jgi:hypothetical protein
MHRAVRRRDRAKEVAQLGGRSRSAGRKIKQLTHINVQGAGQHEDRAHPRIDHPPLNTADLAELQLSGGSQAFLCKPLGFPHLTQPKPEVMQALLIPEVFHLAKEGAEAREY